MTLTHKWYMLHVHVYESGKIPFCVECNTQILTTYN